MTQTELPRAEQPDPQTKTELLARIRAARAELDRTLAGVDEAALSAPGPEGWAVKDHLAHLAAWGRKVLGNMDGRKSTEVLGLSEDVYQRGDWVEINEIVRAPDKNRSAAEILAEYRRVYATLLERIEALPEADLFGADDKLRNNIAGNTYGHDEEHLPWIETVLEYTHSK
jgi:uncharacterized protein (TIGR03083 family)